MFGGSCIGVICLVISLEFLRRAQREFDGYVARRQQRTMPAARTQDDSTLYSSEHSSKQAVSNATSAQEPVAQRSLSMLELLPAQIVRSLLHMIQFAVAYFIMLLAMYYNGMVEL